MKKLRWGIVGAGNAANRILPSMRNGESYELAAISASDRKRASAAAAEHAIPTVHDSYDALLRDPTIDVVWINVATHLHAELAAKAAAAGKHVLCEKPLTVTAEEARSLLAARDRAGVRIQEAVMVRVHPRWRQTAELVKSGAIGQLRAIQGYFGYFFDAPTNFRNKPECGGGGLLDVGCYLITTSRLLGGEPARAVAALDRDPTLGIDRLVSALLEFSWGHAALTCGSQIARGQFMTIYGTTGLIELPMPMNPSHDEPSFIIVNGEKRSVPACDQFALQAELFSRSIVDGTAQPVPLEDSVANMEVIDAIRRSAAGGGWEAVKPVG